MSLPSSTSIAAQATHSISRQKHHYPIWLSSVLLHCCGSIDPTQCLRLPTSIVIATQALLLLIAEQATVYSLPLSVRPTYIRHQQHPFWLLQKHRSSFFHSIAEHALALPIADQASVLLPHPVYPQYQASLLLLKHSCSIR